MPTFLTTKTYEKSLFCTRRLYRDLLEIEQLVYSDKEIDLDERNKICAEIKHISDAVIQAPLMHREPMYGGQGILCRCNDCKKLGLHPYDYKPR